MAAMTSSFGNFKIRGKGTSQISVRSFVEHFIKIHPSVWAHALSHTDTHTHTYIHIHTLGSIATYSVKLTEYKKDSLTCNYGLDNLPWTVFLVRVTVSYLIFTRCAKIRTHENCSKKMKIFIWNCCKYSKII